MIASTQQKETVSNATRRSTGRPDYDIIGADNEGATHIYRTFDETVHVVDADGAREYRFELEAEGITVDQYVAHVESKRGWESRTYFSDLAEAFMDSIEVSR